MGGVRDRVVFQGFWCTPMRDLIRFRVTRRLDWKGVIAQAELPDGVKLVLTRLVGRTRLWRLEKAGIAAELVAHFEDALAGGQDAEQVMMDFGDWRKAARLIRRATKRKRSLVWQAWRWVFRGGAALVLVYALMLVYYLAGSPEVKTNYVALINAEIGEVPEEQQGWPVMREALVAMRYNEALDADEGDALYINPGSAPGGEGWPQTAAYLQANQAHLAELRRGAAMPGFGLKLRHEPDERDRAFFYPDEAANSSKADQTDDPRAWVQHSLFEVSIPHLGYSRSITRLLMSDTHLAIEQDDPQRVYDNIVAIIDLAGHVDEQHLLINQLVTVSFVALNNYLISEIVTGHPDLLSREQLVGLIHRLAEMRDYRVDLSTERYMFYDLVQRVYTDDGGGEGTFVLSAWHDFDREYLTNEEMIAEMTGMPVRRYRALESALTPAAALLVADRKAITAKADEIYDRVQAQITVPMWRQPESAISLEIEALMEGSVLTRTRYMPLLMMVPDNGSVRKTAARLNGNTDGVLCGLVLELYRRDHGGYPGSLDTLVPRYLPEVPIDRITGGPLNYRLIDGRPVVYSFGSDRDDDGGKVAYLDDEGTERDDGVWNWVIEEGETAVDGDWVVWPLEVLD